MAGHEAHIQMAFCPETPKWESHPEIAQVGTPVTLEPHNFAIKSPMEMRSKAKL
jgi:hypothetical protein